MDENALPAPSQARAVADYIIYSDSAAFMELRPVPLPFAIMLPAALYELLREAGIDVAASPGEVVH